MNSMNYQGLFIQLQKVQLLVVEAVQLEAALSSLGVRRQKFNQSPMGLRLLLKEQELASYLSQALSILNLISDYPPYPQKDIRESPKPPRHP